MTQKQFVNELAKESGMTTSETSNLIAQLCSIISDCVIKDQTVMLHGFGSLEKKTKAERKMYNPSTKDYRIIPESASLTFKPSTLLKDKLNPEK